MRKSGKGKHKGIKADKLEQKWNECFLKLYQLKSLVDNEHLSNDESLKYLNDLQSMKDELNKTKSLLNNIDIVKWHKHTKAMHLCGHIASLLARNVKAELVTQAWAKFYTILSTFDLFKNIDVCNINTVHLCEAPGSFVSSLNHYLKSYYGDQIVWNWFATTLNPYHEENSTCQMIEDDRFIIETLPHWEFGPDFTGNIMSLENLTCMEKRFKDVFVTLVTADGSMDCSENPGEQENEVSLLLLWEMITALSVLSNGGSLVLKIFTVFEKFTISLVYFLHVVFQSISFIKPGPSKPGNSEVYLVCKVFLKDECLKSPMFEKFRSAAISRDILDADVFDTIPKSFMHDILDYARVSSTKQIHFIKENLESFTDNSVTSQDELNQIKGYIAKRFINEFSIYPIESYISPLFVLKTKNGLYYNRMTALSFKTGSFNDRIQKNERKRKSIDMENIVNDNKVDILLETSVSINEDLHEITFTPDDTCCCFDSINNFKFILGKKALDINSSRFIPSALLKQYNELRCKYNNMLRKADQTNNCNDEGKNYHYELNKINQFLPTIGIFQRKNMLFISYTSDNIHLVNYFMERSIKAAHKIPTPDRDNESELILQSNFCDTSMFDLITCDLGSIDNVSKAKNIQIMKEVLKNLVSSQTLLVRIEGLVFSSFWHGIFYLLSSLFMNVIFVESRWSKDLYYLIYYDCNATCELVNVLYVYLCRLHDALLHLDENFDVFHVADIYSLMQSKYRKYMVTRNECLAQQFIDVLSKLC